MGYTGKSKLVIVDMAGTIIDGPTNLKHIYPNDDGSGSKTAVITFDETLRKHGMAADWATIRKPQGLFKRDHLKALLADPKVNEQFKKAYGRDWSEEDLNEIFADFDAILDNIITRPELALPIAGAREAIDGWRDRDVVTGSTTGYPTAAGQKLNAYLKEHHGLHIDYSAYPEQVGAGRPQPWMIFKVMRKANIFPPAAVVKIGDTRFDIAEGANAGVWTIGTYTTGSDPYEELAAAGADFLTPSIAQCPDIIGTQIEPRLRRGELPGQKHDA